MTAFAGVDVPSLILGFFLGSFIGALTVALVAVGGGSDEHPDDELQQRGAQR